jgi:hypothetical protein
MVASITQTVIGPRCAIPAARAAATTARHV